MAASAAIYLYGPAFMLVCEAHPSRPWESGSPRDCVCGAPGMAASAFPMPPVAPRGRW